MSIQQDNARLLTGKYRGKVLSTEDLMMKGRLLCEVPALPGMLLNWAMPAVPYAGIEQGMFALPEEGSDVWIEFEQGNPDNPIWSGGYWEQDLEPVMPHLSPEAPELVNVLSSKFCTLTMNDTPGIGGIKLEVEDPDVLVPVSLEMNSLGLSITVGPHKLTINPEVGITLTSAESVMTLTPEGQTTEAPSVEITADANVNITAAETSVESGNTTISGATEIEGPATIAEATVETNLTVTGPTELVGGATVTEQLSSAGETNLTGSVTAEGVVNVAGDMAVEGEAEVAGNLAVPITETMASDALFAEVAPI